MCRTRQLNGAEPPPCSSRLVDDGLQPRLVVLEHQVEQRPAEALLVLVAADALGRGAAVDHAQVPVVEHHRVVAVLDQGAEAALARRQRLLGLRAAHQLPDLPADHGERAQQALVGLAHLAAVEDEHADGLAVGVHREHHRAAHPGLGRELRPRHARVVADVGHPERLAGLPHVAEEADAGGVLHGERLPQVALALRVRDAPGPAGAQHAARLVDVDVARGLPALGLADRLHRGLERLARVARLAEAHRHLVLEAEQRLLALVRAPLVGAVDDRGLDQPGSAVGWLERDQAARDPAQLAVAAPHARLEIAHYALALEHLQHLAARVRVGIQGLDVRHRGGECAGES